MYVCYRPYFAELAGETSVWKAMDPSVLQASFNVDPGLVELFNTKIGKGKNFVPPKESVENWDLRTPTFFFLIAKIIFL